MKGLLLAIVLVFGTALNAQKTFDDGWDDGYTTACEDYNLSLTLIPISPIVMANEVDTYRAGYNRGYKRALKDNNIEDQSSFRLNINQPVTTNIQDQDLDFDDGWEKGYITACEDHNLNLTIVPIAPIVMANEVDTYRAGLNRGYSRALKDNNIDNQVPGSIGVGITNEQTEELDFDDGWEKGYITACEDHNLNLTIVPIAPIVTANEVDTYRAGLNRGYNRALRDNNIDNQVPGSIGVGIANGQTDELDFDDGWEQGYKDGMQDSNKNMFIVPIAPIVVADEIDTYRAGYSRGYQKALEDVND